MAKQNIVPLATTSREKIRHTSIWYANEWHASGWHANVWQAGLEEDFGEGLLYEIPA